MSPLPGCPSCLSHLAVRAQQAEKKVAELEHVEDHVLACQVLVDAGQRDEAIERLMTIYVGGAMKRDLDKRAGDSVGPAPCRVETNSEQTSAAGKVPTDEHNRKERDDMRAAGEKPDSVEANASRGAGQQHSDRAESRPDDQTNHQFTGTSALADRAWKSAPYSPNEPCPSDASPGYYEDCRFYEEDENGKQGSTCGAPATHYSCNFGGPTNGPNACEEHKCRCRQPVQRTNEAPSVPQNAAYDFATTARDFMVSIGEGKYRGVAIAKLAQLFADVANAARADGASVHALDKAPCRHVGYRTVGLGGKWCPYCGSLGALNDDYSDTIWTAPNGLRVASDPDDPCIGLHADQHPSRGWALVVNGRGYPMSKQTAEDLERILRKREPEGGTDYPPTAERAAQWLREVEPLIPCGDVRDEIGFTRCDALATEIERQIIHGQCSANPRSE